MKAAPFLLQTFTARVLAEKREERLLRADLVKQGYDVEMLLEMIAAYQQIPEAERAFIVTATDTHIYLKRKPNTEGPAVRPISASKPPMLPQIAPGQALPAPKTTLEDLLKRSQAQRAKKQR